MQKWLTFLNSQGMQRIDWLLALAALLWGGYRYATEGWSPFVALTLVAALLAAFIAWYRPAQRLQAVLARRFVGRKTKRASS